jgi:Zn-dependent protease with chaperone function
MISRDRRTFPGLSPRTYEHPADRAALVALRAVPGFDVIVRTLAGAVGDRALRLVALASAVRVTERQLPAMHARYLEACAILDVDTPPELYLAQAPFVNAGAIGLDQPFLILNSGTLAVLDDDELQFVLAHELGHVLSGHALYKTMLHLLLRLSTVALGVPLGSTAILALTTALLEWDRSSELSADRAGLLVVQSPEIAMRANMKLAGGLREGLQMDEFIRQAEEYQASGTVRDSLLKLLTLLGRTHPFPVLRLAEIKRWVDSGDYDRVLAGDYAKRDQDKDASFRETLRDASRSYQEAFSARTAPVADAVRDVAREARAVQKAILTALRDWARPADDDPE